VAVGRRGEMMARGWHSDTGDNEGGFRASSGKKAMRKRDIM